MRVPIKGYSETELRTCPKPMAWCLASSALAVLLLGPYKSPWHCFVSKPGGPAQVCTVGGESTDTQLF